jgi:predicted Zn-dependent protease
VGHLVVPSFQTVGQNLTIRQRISQAAALLAGDPSAAEQIARQVLKESPSDPSAALIVASALRRRGDIVGAGKLLEPLAKAHPRAALTWFELGMARAGAGEDEGAIAALSHALSLNQEMPQAWEALGNAHFRRGEVDAMDAAFLQQLKYGLRDPRLRQVADALAANRPGDAEKLLRDHLRQSPGDADALRILGDTLIKLERPAEAEAALERALVLAPQFDGARFSYATALFQQQKAGQSVSELRALLAKAPHMPSYRNLLAAALSLAGDFDEVEQLYSGLVAEFPRQPKLWLNYAHALKTTGHADPAMQAYRRCIALAPGFGAAWCGLANMKTAKFSDTEAAAMTALLADPALPESERLDIHAALGKALEDRKNYAASFAHYATSAKLRRARVVWSAGANTARLRKSEAVLTRAFFAARAGSGDPAPDPIFILGLPRSGSTLVEQILSSHSQVEGTMELPDMGRAATALARAHGCEDWLDCVERVPRDAFAATGRAYLASTRIYRKTARRFFIDKMPNNFQHAGLIHLALPGAKIIDARRAPMASCFSAFKQHFAQGQAFSCDLADLGLFYRDYVALMAHFDRVLPRRIHRVIYEDMVENTEGEIRRLLDYCGLGFEPACLRFYETERAVRTVSSEQVRQPIYRGGLEQWKAYEPWLGPLKAALGPAVENWR